MRIEAGRRPARRGAISGLMVGVAALGFNLGLVRAFLVEDKLAGALPLAFALQLATWRFFRTRRRFWLGFLVAGAAAVPALFACELFPASGPSRLLGRYVALAFDLAHRHFPTVLDDLIWDHQDWFLVVAYILPELVAAILGGFIALVLPTGSPAEA